MNPRKPIEDHKPRSLEIISRQFKLLRPKKLTRTTTGYEFKAVSTCGTWFAKITLTKFAMGAYSSAIEIKDYEGLTRGANFKLKVAPLAAFREIRGLTATKPIGLSSWTVYAS